MSDHHGVIEFRNEPYLGASWAVIILTGITLAILVFGAMVYYRSAQSEVLNAREIHGQPTQELMALRQYEAQTLHALKWTDKSKGQVQIPIDLAMTLVQQQYQSR